MDAFYSRKPRDSEMTWLLQVIALTMCSIQQMFLFEYSWTTTWKCSLLITKNVKVEVSRCSEQTRFRERSDFPHSEWKHSMKIMKLFSRRFPLVKSKINSHRTWNMNRLNEEECPHVRVHTDRVINGFVSDTIDRDQLIAYEWDRGYFARATNFHDFSFTKVFVLRDIVVMGVTVNTILIHRWFPNTKINHHCLILIYTIILQQILLQFSN